MKNIGFSVQFLIVLKFHLVFSLHNSGPLVVPSKSMPSELIPTTYFIVLWDAVVRKIVGVVQKPVVLASQGHSRCFHQVNKPHILFSADGKRIVQFKTNIF